LEGHISGGSGGGIWNGKKSNKEKAEKNERNGIEEITKDHLIEKEVTEKRKWLKIEGGRRKLVILRDSVR
jgi:hypothetical protein